MESNEVPTMIKAVEVCVTERCNARCTYCYHTKKPVDMTDETMEAMLRTFKGHVRDSVRYTFFGGEPMLRIDFMTKWIDRLLQESPKNTFSISTNGRIFNREFATLWKNLHAMFQVSYDGVCQEANRGDAENVRENIKGYLSILGPKYVKVRLTYNRSDVEKLYDNVVDCYNLGIRDLYPQPAMIKEEAGRWTEEDIEKYRKQVDRIYEFLEQHPDLKMRPYDCDLIIKRHDHRVCGMGRILLCVNAVGNIYPCHRMTPMDSFILGNVHDGSFNRGRFLKIGLRKSCDSCFARVYCSPCLVANYIANGSFREPVAYICNIGTVDYLKAQETHNKTYREVYDKKQTIITMLHVLEDVKKGNAAVIKGMRKCITY